MSPAFVGLQHLPGCLRNGSFPCKAVPCLNAEHQQTSCSRSQRHGKHRPSHFGSGSVDPSCSSCKIRPQQREGSLTVLSCFHSPSFPQNLMFLPCPKGPCQTKDALSPVGSTPGPSGASAKHVFLQGLVNTRGTLCLSLCICNSLGLSPFRNMSICALVTLVGVFFLPLLKQFCMSNVPAVSESITASMP